MRITISDIAWDIKEELKIVKIMNKYLIKGVEIAPTKIWKNPTAESKETIKTYKSFWKKNGIEITSMQSVLFERPDLNIFSNSSQRLELLKYLEKIMKIGNLLGAQVIVFGSPKNRNIEKINPKDVLKIAEDFFYKIGKLSQSNNIFFCIEPSAKQYGTNFINNTTEAINLIKKVNHPNFRLHLDSGVMEINNENYNKSINLGYPYLKHFHVSEINLLPIESSNKKHKEISIILNNLNYNKWISIEMKGNNNFSNLKTVDNVLKFVSSTYG
jgi:sugar phosphate isomerase/epimerase